MENKFLKPFLVGLLTVIAAIILGHLIGSTTGGAVAAGILICAAIVFTTLLNVEAGLVVLIFAMFLSPEIKLAEIPSRDVVIRLDDILIGLAFLVTLARGAITKEASLFGSSPLHLPLFAYTSVLVISTALGIFRDSSQALKSMFYLLKYLEYFMLYFMVANVVRERRQVLLFLKAGFLTFFCVMVYVYATLPYKSRATAPFEVGYGEPNTLAGYLLIVFALSISGFNHLPKAWQKAGMLTTILATMPAFIKTLSRSSFAAFVPLYLVVTLFAKKGRAGLIFAGLLAFFVFPYLIPDLRHTLMERFEYTTGRFAEIEFTILGREIKLEPSTAIRIQSWQHMYHYWLAEHPVFGRGPAGVGLVDAQYPLIIGETGLAGLFCFFWTIGKIFTSAFRTYRFYDDPLSNTLSLGLMASVAALCTQAFGTNTFILIRIMEPFWFLTAIVLQLPKVLESEEEKK